MQEQSKKVIAAHDQKESHSYVAHYPEHGARPSDPHYKDFEAFKKKNKATARCMFADYAGSSDCKGGLELHHSHIEFAVTNGVDLAILEKYYPGVSNPDEVGAWVESGKNFMWLCEFHHRGHGGAHVAAAADWETEKWIKDFIS